MIGRSIGVGELYKVLGIGAQPRELWVFLSNNRLVLQAGSYPPAR